MSHPDTISEDVKNLGGIAKADAYGKSLASLRDQIESEWKPGDQFRFIPPQKYLGAYPEIEGRLGRFIAARWRKDHTIDVQIDWIEACPLTSDHPRYRMRGRKSIGGGMFRVSAQKAP